MLGVLVTVSAPAAGSVLTLAVDRMAGLVSPLVSAPVAVAVSE